MIHLWTTPLLLVIAIAMATPAEAPNETPVDCLEIEQILREAPEPYRIDEASLLAIVGRCEANAAEA